MAFLREPSSREPVFRAPASVIGLIALIVAAHVARVLAPSATSQAILENLALIPARYLAPPTDVHALLADAAPFIGYIFLHANATHLIVNCLWLLAFGAPVARRYGGIAFFALFFVCGIAAALAQVAGDWGADDAAIGASGAIAGIMAAGLRMVGLADPFGQREGRPLQPIWSRQVLVFSAVWVIANVVTGTTGLGNLPGVGPIAWQAHIGGFFAGLLLAGPMDRLIVREASDSGIAA